MSRCEETVVFLDRDGTLNKNFTDGPVYNLNRFELLPMAAQAVRSLNDMNIPALLITNQGGINHEKRDFSWGEYHRIEDKMHSDLKEQADAHIDKVYVCGHASYEDCKCRKPRVGFLREAQKEYGYTPSRSFIVGDSAVDIIAGKRMKLHTILVTSGWQHDVEGTLKEQGVTPDVVLADVAEAVQYMRKRIEHWS